MLVVGDRLHDLGVAFDCDNDSSLEPAIAREAAINATDADVKKIRTARDMAREASDWTGYEAADDLLHRSIAEATSNARKAAEQFAKDSGAHVGTILHANQGYFTLDDRDEYTPEIKKIRVVTSVDYLLTD